MVYFSALAHIAMHVRLPLVAAFIAAASSCSTYEGAQEASEAEVVSDTACVAGARPSSGFGLEPALGDQRFTSPIAMLPLPGAYGGGRFLVAEKIGVIKLVSAEGETSLFADLRSRVNARPNEAGLLGVALHPQFAQNGLVFLSYTKPSSTTSSGIASVIAKAQVAAGGATLDLATLRELLSFDQPYANHNGGHIAFGKDGYLYAGFGDGGSGGDPLNAGQRLDTPLGKMLRIDVDNGSPYAIPPTNPFANGGGLKEIYAWGLRNPWRWSFDRRTGDLWAGDVGQGKWEEVDKIVLGGNYGWKVREGNHCYSATSCSESGFIPAVAEYGRSDGYSITGGFVYRGKTMRSLVGHYFYGDFGSGKIWTLDTAAAAPTPRLLMQSGANIASFAEDAEGELYVLDYGAGKVRKIVETQASDGIPQRLSETGCFSANDPTKPTRRLVPYDINSPLWSDGADKARWMALPVGEKIRVAADGHFEFPVGTVLVKEFAIGGKRVETRLFMRHTDGAWAGYSYEWNDAGTDATLLATGKTKVVGEQTWQFPSRAQCNGCHNGAAGFTLGPESAQLDREYTYPDGTTSNQLTKLAALGYFHPDTPPSAAPVRPLVSPASTEASLEDRARSYLHANCAFCHRPDAPGRGVADMRWDRSFADTKLCNGDLETGAYGVIGAKLVVPGNSASSMLAVRMHATDERRMPPLASSIVDGLGTSVVDQWIMSLESCP